MQTDLGHDRHGDLAALLASWRHRLSPVDVGLPAATVGPGSKRRAVGLRREELAALAGLSVDYVVRLEQGRSRNPSDQVTAALARALQLTDVERDHLYRVAGLLPPSPGDLPRHIPPGVARLVARLGEAPVAVFTASWDLLTWSPLWAALIGDPTAVPVAERNLLRVHFAGGTLGGETGSRIRPEDATRLERSLVADLRGVRGRYPGDRGIARLIDDLLASSARFGRLWETAAVGEHVSETKLVTNSVVGELMLDCDVFSSAGGDLRIVAYTAAAGSEAAEKLDFLRVSAVANAIGATAEKAVAPRGGTE